MRCAIPLTVLLLMSVVPGRTGAQVPYLPSVSQTCSIATPGRAAVTFNWPAPPPGAIQQWLDLSLFNNGFVPGTFVGVGPFGPQTTSFTWQGILPGLTHYYRLNVLYPDGWHPSATGYFVSCEPGKAALGDVRQFCTPQGVEVTFNWSPTTPPGTVQWLDLSLSDNGFVPGTFVAAGPLSGNASSFVWNGLAPGRTHYWRVNTLHLSLGWQASARDAFRTGCERTSSLPSPQVGESVSAGGLARVVVANDSPYELAVEMRGPQAYSFTIPRCGTCHEYFLTGPLFGCPTGIPRITHDVRPGDYTVNVSAVGHPEIATFIGQWSLRANKKHSSCLYVVTTFG
ncbi:MAG: hypothetical protein WBF66_00810 [Dehalococcoidia bacterium]